jgi:FtsZ-binding cell division protein ZapB
MRTREGILSEVLSINREIEELQERINSLYTEAKNIEDIYDDEERRNSYLECIKSYAQ